VSGAAEHRTGSSGEETCLGSGVPTHPDPYAAEKTHYAASLVSAADQQIPDDSRVVLEELITETGR
jgi:hypothetical protein